MKAEAWMKDLAPKEKPGIIVTCADDADEFTWWSDGWYQMKYRHRVEAQRLMEKASGCIDAASDVPDAIRRLKGAGFNVTRDTTGLEGME